MARTQVAKAHAAVGKAMSETVVRQRARQSVAMTLHHSIDASRWPDRLMQIQNGLAALGMSLVIAPPTDDSAALAASEAHIERLNAEKRALQAQIEALQATIEAQLNAMPAEGTRWMTLPEAKKIIGKSYSTLHRAHVEGRMVTRIIGGTKKNQIMCDPSTYRGKGSEG